jgi:hypothetical protein
LPKNSQRLIANKLQQLKMPTRTTPLLQFVWNQKQFIFINQNLFGGRESVIYPLEWLGEKII